MNAGSPLALAFWLFIAVLAVAEAYHQREQRRWHREQGARAVRDHERYVSGLSDAVLSGIPDDELSDAELCRKIEREAREWGTVADLEVAYNAPAGEPRAW